MSRITKWKVEKTKVKVVFRLQFHATHIPQTGWERLFISFIPTESGKVTAKTTKANVRNGTCKWGDPIYETTRLLLDAKSKLFDDKLYKLVVGMGSTRSSILGEAIINLADYADALKPSAVALPLHGTDAGTILHVTVQLLTSKTGFREFEQQRELRETGLPIGSNLNRHGESGSAKVSSSEQKFKDQADKVETRIRFTKESKALPSLEEVGESEEYTNSQIGYDGSSNTSGSLYADKHDNSSTHDIDSVRSTISGDLNRPTEKGDPSDHRILTHGSNEWVQGWSSDYSMDNELVVDSEENNRLRGSLETAESSIFELKLELNSLQSHAEEIGLETQKLANQLVTEIASGQELAKEVSVLKSQCSKFKDDLEQLKSVKLSPEFSNIESDLYEPESKLSPKFKDDSESMKGKILELVQQLDEAKNENETLVRKMDKMECYYEALVHELEENQKQIMGEFYSLRNDHSTCVYTISACKSETESIRNDINEQALRFAEERLALDTLNKELERRAITSESALKRARLNYSIAVNQLQKDLDLLSYQVLTMFETNQNLINDAFSEPSQLFFQGYSNVGHYPRKCDDGVKNDLLGGDILSDDMKKSLCLQEDLYQKLEVESSEMRYENLYLDIYSNTLKETLVEAGTDIKVLRNKMDEYAQQLELSSEDKAGCLAQCNHLLLQNQILEAKLESISKENFFLTEKLIDCEDQVMGYKDCERKYEACFAEKLELENCLKVEILEKGDIQKEMLSLREEFQNLKDKCDELAVSKESMQKHSTFLQDKLGSMLASYHSSFGEVSLFSSSAGPDLESKDIKDLISDLEESQQNICGKMVKLIEEKKGVENERDMALLSLNTTRSEVLDMKKKFKNDVQDMVAKLDISNFLVEKLQLQLESVANKFHISLESEEKYLQHGEELLAYLASLDLELQKLSSQNGDLVQEIMGLGTMAEELGRCKLTISELMQEKQNHAKEILCFSSMAEELGKTKISISELNQEKQELVMSLKGKTDEFITLASEVDSLADELGRSKMIISELLQGKKDLELSVQSKSEEYIKLKSELHNLAEELGGSKLTISELMRQNKDLSQEILGFKTMAEELGGSKLIVTELMKEKQELLMSLGSKTDESIKLKSELDRMAEELGGKISIISELMQEKQDHAREILGLKTIAEELGGSKLTISELLQERESFVMSLQSKTEKTIKLESELDRLTEELGRSKLTISELMHEKQDLTMSLESKTEESIKLIEEKKGVENERDMAVLSLSTARSEVLDMKQKFKNDILGTVAKLDISNFMVEKLQLQLESVANKFHISTEREEKYLQHGEELLAYLASLELELQKISCKNGDLTQEILGLGTMGEELGRCKLTISELIQEKQNLAQEILGLDAIGEELGKTKICISELTQEKQELMMSLEGKTEEYIKIESELHDMAEELGGSKLAVSELMRENKDLAQEISGLKTVDEELGGSKSIVTELMHEKQDLVMCLRSKTEESIKLKSELDRMAEELGEKNSIVFELMQEKQEHVQEILGLKTVADELGGSKLTIGQLLQEKENLVRSLDSKNEETIKLESELDRVAEELGRSKLTISELMQEKQNLTMSLESKTEESIKLESELYRVADELGMSKLTVSELLQEKRGLFTSLQNKIEDSTVLKSELDRLNDSLRCVNDEMHIERGFRDELESTIANLTCQLAKEQEKMVHFEHQNAELVHFRQLASDLKSENSSALNLQLQHEENVETLQKEICSFNALQCQLIEMEENLISADVKLCFVQTQYETRLEELVRVLLDFDQEIASLILSTEESEIIKIVLKAKLDEQNTHLTLLEEHNDELIVLQDRCHELTRKLSEQILKTEEFKNMSIYLKELKEKAEAEYALAREKRESEGPSIAVQESLRIAFIKEQYETKLQELRQQLSMSKRHGEEILFKLQDAIDENENRKKSEVSYLKKNEELSLKVLELEAELQSLVSDKREKVNDYDRMKTELECTLLSLECCKEEKEKLNAYIQKYEEEKTKMDDSASISTGNPLPSSLNGTSLTDREGVPEASSVPKDEVGYPTSRLSAESIQEVLNSKGVDGTQEHVIEDGGDLLLGNSKRLAVVNDHFRAQTLRSSMEHLDEELERMKNENSLLSPTKFDPTFQDLQKELLQLQKVNRELASIYPLFNDLAEGGNALERVLALEIELAEALRAKKKSSILFQSSFLKQHSDEEAIYKSFRDINELIRDMLELKGKYTNMETELTEMHDRYSQLSLQFAEVEGERQKLSMTLKNVRASKRHLQLNRSSSAILTQGDHPL